MYAGVQADSLFIRLSAADQKEITRISDEITLFEPVAGRIMKEYVVLPDSLLSDKEFTKEWLTRSFEFVSSLPEKKPKTTKK